MLDVSTLRSVSLADAKPGSIVAFREAGSYFPGLRITAADNTTPGLLTLPRSGQTSHATLWTHTNNRVIELGQAGRFQWDGQWDVLSDSTKAFPLPGHLLVAGDHLLISGVVPGMTTPSSPTYWNTKDGKIFKLVEFSSTFAVAKWELVLDGSDGKPHRIAAFPP